MGQSSNDIADRLRFVPLAEFSRVRGLQGPAAPRVKLLATLARINVLYMIARAGFGHVGSAFSSLEIVSWLHEVVMTKTDRYFSSKGHDVAGLYAVLMGLGRLPVENLDRFQRQGGLPGHPDIGTPGIVVNTGSLGMGISKAKGLVRAARARGERRRIFVLTGDGELQEGQIWESLGGAVRDRFQELVVIVDHNKWQSDTDIETVLPLGDLDARFCSFGWAVARADGHNPDALQAALLGLERDDGGQPKVIIADTVKGSGVSFMAPTAKAPYAFHSGGLTAEQYNKAVSELLDLANAALALARAEPLRLEAGPPPVWLRAPGRVDTLVDAYAGALVEAGARRPGLHVLDADLAGVMGLVPFRTRFPDRFVECGIAEQDMVSQASGMARGGLLPVVHSFAAFLTQRASEQILNAASERTRIVYVGGLAGLIPAGPGSSHQAIRDIAAMASVPGMTVVEPCCAAEVAPLFNWCLDDAPGPSYLRLVSEPWPVPFALPPDYRPTPGRGVVLHDGWDAAVIGYGPIVLAEAYEAARLLRRDGVTLKVIGLPWLNHVDADWLAGVLAGVGVLFTLDNHVRSGGQGQLIAAMIASQQLGKNLQLHGVALEGWPVCGTPAEALDAHGLSARRLAAGIAEALGAAPAARTKEPG